MSEEDDDYDYYTPSEKITDYKGNYPLHQMEKVRKHLISQTMSVARSRFEMEIKRKCGILTKEVVDFYLREKKPENFVELVSQNTPDRNPFIHQELDIDQDDLVPINSSNDTSNNTQDSTLPSYSSDNTLGSFITSDLTPRQPSFTSHFQMNDFLNKNLDNDIKRLQNELKMNHGCDSKFCLKDLPIKEKLDLIDMENMVYRCDFCPKTVSLKSNMLSHLNEEGHMSASEYIVDTTPVNNINSQMPYAEYFIETEKKIKYLKMRCSVRSTIYNGKLAIFCPLCQFCFMDSILAASLHYKYCHSLTKEDQIYSVCERDRSVYVVIEKIHTCPTCKIKFKKLSDLANHLLNTAHFPQNQQNEINVLICPFDNCYFKSTKFFSFKTHILGHAFFNKPDNDIKLEVKVDVYRAPKTYCHIVPFKENCTTESERINEVAAIDELLGSTKNHQDTTEIYKKVRERKSKLSRYQDRDGVNF